LGVKKAFSEIKNNLHKKIIVGLFLSLLGWYAVSSFSVFPYYLTYYNELGGGPANGYQVAVDSNYDWCQDVKRLANWVNEQKIDKIYVDIFTNEDLDYRMKGKYVWWRHSSWWYWLGTQTPEAFPPGNYLAVSATFLQEGRAKPVMTFDPFGREYEWLNAYQQVARVGNSIFVYYIP
jgi:hypothetical protein